MSSNKKVILLYVKMISTWLIFIEKNFTDHAIYHCAHSSINKKITHLYQDIQLNQGIFNLFLAALFKKI